MCGIVGCVLKNEKAAPVLLDCISKLEYRGYDSVGIATENKEINIKKDAGKIIEVDNKLNLANMEGSCGIAHVRWATHGDPNQINSHPHTDENQIVAVVHNGIIENYLDIKENLEKANYPDCDTFDVTSEVTCATTIVQTVLHSDKNLTPAVSIVSRNAIESLFKSGALYESRIGNQKMLRKLYIAYRKDRKHDAFIENVVDYFLKMK